MIPAVDLFQVHAHDDRLGLVADKTLAGKRAELPTRSVPDRLAGGLAHAAIREPDAGWRHRRHTAASALARLTIVEHAARYVLRQFAGERRLLDPTEASGMTVKFPGANLLQFVRRDPFPLIVGVEQIAVRIEVGDGRLLILGSARRGCRRQHSRRT